ncbi:MAG: hypothetical protein GWM98_23320, partial [Nitrospinaceae bacterium]|nr:hypothetical protein [Nitrospinaceae bacterium]NIR56851.1 hypothetical protein [Nitrospinaceae bacterium]NIS87317.1 hypothetical protein [Nitrospinaceae bacterium]NIT84171.1 hypothetical protein [Nitrospinaceae bacterium]NIU46357.1 hypothetical protein [Nitrospinaceae bacterium]
MSRFVDHKSGVTRRILALGIFSLALGLTACSGGGGPETAGKSPSGDSAQPVAEQSPALEGSGYNAERQGQTAQKMAQGAPAVPEGSESAAGKGDKDLNHPSVAPQEVLEREVFVPESIQGRWKAVKIRIRDKRDPNQTQVHTVELGQGFPLGDT